MKYRHIALLTAISLLCGCSGSPAPSENESTAEPPAVTAEISEPEQTTAPESNAPAGITGSDTADNEPIPDNSQGVQLESGDWTEYDNLFDINGSWCDPEQLPLSKAEYKLPEKWLKKDITYTFGNNTMYLTARDKMNSHLTNTNTPEVWYIDLATGEERLVFSGTEGTYEIILYAGEKYLVVIREAEYESDPEICIISALIGEELFSFPQTNGNILLQPQNGTQIIYDTMYVSGEYSIPDLGKTVDAMFTIDLLTGKLNYYGVNRKSPAYGSANLYWYEGNTLTNILGETALELSYIGGKQVTSSMDSGYYTITEITDFSNVLGYRSKLYWGDHDENHEDACDSQHFLGETGYSVYLYNLHMTKDCIFATFINTIGGGYTNMMIGKYDTDTESACASIIDLSDSGSNGLYSDNYNIYLMNRLTKTVTIYSLGEEQQ